MYAHKFVPQNSQIAQFMHSYCLTTSQTTKIQEKNLTATTELNKIRASNEVYVSDDDSDTVQFNKKHTRVLVYESDDDSACDTSLLGDCEFFDVRGDESIVEVCDGNASNIVQVHTVDSGIAADEHIRTIDTAVSFEYMPGKRQSSKLLLTTEEQHLYVKNSTSSVGEGWKCYFAAENKCLACYRLCRVDSSGLISLKMNSHDVFCNSFTECFEKNLNLNTSSQNCNN